LPSFSHIPYRGLARVLQLHGNFCTVAVNALGELAQARDKVIAGHADLERRGGARRERH